MYILSIIAVIAVIILSGWYNQGLWGYLIDTPSFLLILILWIPIMLSSGLFGDFGKAFQFAVGGKKIKKCSELKRANVCRRHLSLRMRGHRGDRPAYLSIR